EPLGEEEGEDPLLHLRLQGLEEDEDDERGDERVEEEEARALASRPADEETVDGGEDEPDAGEDDDLAEQLVEIEEPVTLDRLREEVEVDGHRHVGEGRRRPAGDADEQLAKRKPDAEGGAHPQIEEALPLGATRRPPHA